MYQYKAQLRRAVDGDTVDLMVDLGFYMYANIRVRVKGVDTPERGEEGFHEATDFVVGWFALHDNECLISTEKTGKYGRWIADITPIGIRSGPSLTECLIDEGLGKPYG